MRAVSNRQAAVRRLAVPKSFAPRLTVADALRLPVFSGSTVVAGHAGLGRCIEQVNVMQVPTERYAKPDELVLAAAAALESPAPTPARLIQALAMRGVSALAVRGASLSALVGRPGLRAAADRHLPLIELTQGVHLSEVQAEVLEHIVAAQGTELRLAVAVRDRLADAVLSSGDLSRLAETMSEILEGDVVVTGRDAEVLASSGGADETGGAAAVAAWVAADQPGPCEVGEWVVWPVAAGGRQLGSIAAGFAGGNAEVRLATLEHGATVAALQMLYRTEALEADARLLAGFVRDLVSGSLDPQSAERRARALGWSPDQAFRALLIDAEPDVTEEVVRWLRGGDPPALVTEHAGECLLLLPSAAEGTDQAESVLDVTEWLGAHGSLYVGLSRRHAGLDPLPLALCEAQQALRAARLFGARTRIRRYEDLGVLELLLDLPPEELRAFADDMLAPLDRLRPQYAQALQQTLELLLECNLNVALTARRGRWHYNTVRSRAARLTGLLGPFMEDGMTLDSVALALLLDRELSPPASKGRGSREPA